MLSNSDTDHVSSQHVQLTLLNATSCHCLAASQLHSHCCHLLVQSHSCRLLQRFHKIQIARDMRKLSCSTYSRMMIPTWHWIIATLYRSPRGVLQKTLSLSITTRSVVQLLPYQSRITHSHFLLHYMLSLLPFGTLLITVIISTHSHHLCINSRCITVIAR